MTLSDGDVAVLAEQAAALIPPPVAVRIVPAAADDPYRWGVPEWTIHFDVDPGGGGFGVYVRADESPAQVLERLVDGSGELSETRRFWGHAFPRCLPGHHHPAEPGAADEPGELLWRCPDTGEEVLRLRPEV